MMIIDKNRQSTLMVRHYEQSNRVGVPGILLNRFPREVNRRGPWEAVVKPLSMKNC